MSRPRIIHVHGTFSFSEHAEATAEAINNNETIWWQRKSPFHEYLSTEFSDRMDVVVEGKPLPRPRPWWRRWGSRTPSSPLELDGAFQWSGANSESLRRAAGKLLLGYLRELERNNIPYHIIAHSHGGNVVWQAMLEVTRQPPESSKEKVVPQVATDADTSKSAVTPDRAEPANPEQPATEATEQLPRLLPNLMTWTTVGTPFLLFRPDWRKAVASLVLVLSLIVIGYLQFNWFAEYWHQVPNRDGSHWSVTLATTCLAVFSFAVVLTSLLVVFFLLGQAFWLVMRGRDKSLIEPRTAELVISGLIAIGCGLVVGVFSWWMIGWDQLLPRLRLDTLVVSALFGIFCVLLWSGIRTIFDYWRARGHAANNQAAWIEFGGRHTAINHWEADEPTLALSRAKAGINFPFLPSPRYPMLYQYSDQCLMLLRPESEEYLLSFKGWCSQMVGSPVQLGKTILLFGYDQLVAPVIETFVLNQVHKAAFGIDVPGETIDAVEVCPISSVPPQGPLPRIRLIDEAAMSKLTKEADANLAAIVTSLRPALVNINSSAYAQLASVFKNAMGGKNLARCLVHTTYFDECVRTPITDILNGEDGTTLSDLPKLTGTVTENAFDVRKALGYFRGAVMVYGSFLSAAGAGGALGVQRILGDVRLLAGCRAGMAKRHPLFRDDPFKFSRSARARVGRGEWQERPTLAVVGDDGFGAINQ